MVGTCSSYGTVANDRVVPYKQNACPFALPSSPFAPRPRFSGIMEGVERNCHDRYRLAPQQRHARAVRSPERAAREPGLRRHARRGVHHPVRARLGARCPAPGNLGGGDVPGHQHGRHHACPFGAPVDGSPRARIRRRLAGHRAGAEPAARAGGNWPVRAAARCGQQGVPEREPQPVRARRADVRRPLVRRVLSTAELRRRAGRSVRPHGRAAGKATCRCSPPWTWRTTAR